MLCVDRILASAEETVAMIEAEGGKASAFGADVTHEAAGARRSPPRPRQRLGRIDILHNNVGIGGRDRSITQLEESVTSSGSSTSI